MFELKGIGLVLSGGGGKGAYQVGVLKALAENGLLDDVTAISGASIGAVNAMLYAMEDIELMYKAWEEIEMETIFDVNLEMLSQNRYYFSRDEMLSMIDPSRENCYIANIVKCRPPGNRNPQDDEANACLDYLRNQVILVKPKIIVLLGSVALKNILGKEYGITASRGKWIERKGILYMPTWHPAALLRDESKKIDFIRDLQEVMRRYR